MVIIHNELSDEFQFILLVNSAFEGSPPIIRFGPANQTLPTETIALLFCEVLQPVDAELSGPAAPKVKVGWLKNGQPIVGTDRRFIQLDSGTLQINSKFVCQDKFELFRLNLLFTPSLAHRSANYRQWHLHLCGQLHRSTVDDQ